MELKLINKSFDELNNVEKIQVLSGYAKAIDGATAFRVGGTLSAEQFNKFFLRIGEQSKFLKMIRRIDTSRTTYDLNALAIGSRVLVRPTSGAAHGTDTDANISSVGNELVLKRVQLVYILDYDAIQDNLDNPNFQESVNLLTAQQFANDLSDLSINGTDDDYSGSAFLELNKGFLTLFAADSDVNDVTYASFDTKVELFAAMLAKLPEKFRSRNDLSIFVNYSDFDAYADELSSGNASGSAYLGAESLRYHNIPIVPVDFMPENKAFLTSASNLVWGVGKNNMLSMTAVNDPEGVCWRLIYNMMVDYNYFDGTLVVLAS